MVFIILQVSVDKYHSMIIVKPFQSVPKDKLFDFLRNARLSNEPASINMFDDNWESMPNTLPYKLFVEQIYNNGMFNVALDNDNIIACSGCYTSSFHKDILISGSRTWVNKEYRTKRISTEYMLPVEKKWAIDNNYKIIALTFNEYNKNIITAFTRNGLGYSVTPKDSINRLFHSNMNVVSFPVTIQYTKQYVIYEKLTDWDFDWKTINTQSESSVI